MTSDRVAKIRELIDSAGSTYVSVNFIKKDGSLRQLTFNPADHNDIVGTGSEAAAKVDENIFRIRDTKKQAWRSFDARRVISIKANGKVTEFNDD